MENSAQINRSQHLLEHHYKHLRNESGISDELIAEATLFSVSDEEATKYIGAKFGGIVFLYLDLLTQEVIGCRVRLDNPPPLDGGSSIAIDSCIPRRYVLNRILRKLSLVWTKIYSIVPKKCWQRMRKPIGRGKRVLTILSLPI